MTQETEGLTPKEVEVLDRIRKGPVTRQGLIDEGIISSSAASDILSKLKEVDRIREVGHRRVSNRGRARTLWCLTERHPEEVE